METGEYAKMAHIENTHWWFVAKREFLRIALSSLYPALEGKRVLDVGCGTGAIMQYFKTRGAVVEGVDMSPEALHFCAEKNLNAQLGTAEHIPYADNSFDIVVASDVLEHVEDHESAVREIHRVLKPGGVFLVTVPAHQFLFSYHDTALHHVRRYSKRQFSDVLRRVFPQVHVSWIHAGILIPALFIRLVGSLRHAHSESDVRENSRAVNSLLGTWYRFEFLWLRVFGSLPWGLSLMSTARK